MPVVLPREAWSEWLSEGMLALDVLEDLFLPAPDGSIVAYRVAPLVNDVHADGPSSSLPTSITKRRPKVPATRVVSSTRPASSPRGC